MAGRLPGVGLSPRKKSQQHNAATYRHSYLRESSLDLETPLDETTFKAKQRLQKKLHYFFPSSRLSEEKSKKEGKESKRSLEKKEVGLGRKLLEKSWLLGGNNKIKKEIKVCAICLDGFHKNEEVMKLSCSHKYHSSCLLPWLQVHPHCPYCRTIVQSR